MAADLTDQIARAAGQVEPSWSPERAAGILRAVYGQKQRQRRRRALGAATVVVLLAVLSPRLMSAVRTLRSSAGPTSLASQSPGSTPPLLEAERPAEPLRLRDGSVVQPQGPASQVRVREDRPGRTVVELAGAAQFAVVHDPQRLFRVETRGLAVEVLGTRFFVEEQGPRVRVTVQQGRVRVLWASHYDELGAGQSRLFYPEPPLDAGSTATAAGLMTPPLDEPAPTLTPPLLALPSTHAVPPLRSATRRTARSPRTAPVPAVAVVVEAAPAESGPASWQTLAHEGQFEQAYRVAYEAAAGAAHHPAEPLLLREREVAPGELLLLADVARLSHHPADAMAPLSRLLHDHAADPRAPLAAFTLGRVLLDDLGRPREAAQSFVRVQQLDPDGPLSQDALAREVEAWSRAGEAASARARALQYVQKYPAGRRLRSVRHFGELL